MSARRQKAITLLHLAAWAQCAVLARFYIVAALGAACHSPQGSPFLPCVTSPGLLARGGALFLDLPSNACGCFIMGLLAPADVLALAHRLPGVTGAIPLLPSHSPLQSHTPLLIGLRTGFCGTLTTYANWMLQMVRMLVGGVPSNYNTEWVAALAGLFVGQAVAMQALVLGQQVAVVIWSLHSGAAKHQTVLALHSAPPANGMPKDGVKLGPDGSAPKLEQHPQQAQHALCTSEASVNRQAPQAAPQEAPVDRAPCAGPAWVWASDLAALLVLCTLTGVALAYLVLDLRSETLSAGRPRSYVWFAILFAPFGCYLRWKLSSWNACPLLKDTSWAWLPVGTLLANQIAMANSIMIAILAVRLSGITWAQDSAMFAAMAGFSGGLSTVSTWIVEVEILNLLEPERARGYVYASISMGTSLLLGIVGYGAAVWTL